MSKYTYVNDRNGGDCCRPGLRFLAILLMVACCLGGRQAMAGGGGESMLLVVNPNDASSLQIANAYAALRNIPANNIIFIAPPAYYQNDGNPITQADVMSTYLTPISAAITARGLTGQINYIGNIGGPVSYTVTPPGGLPYSTAASFNYALDLLTPLTNGSGLTLQNSIYTSSKLYQSPSNTLFDDNPAVLHSASYTVYYSSAGKNISTQYYMSSAIGYTGTNGNTAAQVIASLQSAAGADGTRPGGAVYFEDNGDIRATTRHGQWSATETQLTARGIPWVYENNTPGCTPQNRTNVSGAACGQAWLTLPNGSTYLPGSWADNLTSFGCYFPDTGQIKSTVFIADGAAGTCGAVVEPYAIAARFTNSSIYTFIADGSTLAEAFTKSVQIPDILMPLGDMLAQPYADIPKVAFTSGPCGYGNVKGTVSIAASASLTSPHIATGISKLQLAVDGLIGASVTGGSGSFSLNTTTLSDGIHEVRVVGVNNAQAASEGYTTEEIVVNNHGRSINFSGGDLTLLSSAASIGLTAAAGDGTISQIKLTCLGRVVGQASGSPGTISLSPTALATGDNTIVPVAVYSDGMQVAGGAFVVHCQSGPASTWGNAGATGLWSNPANWSGGVLPQNGDKVARFGGGTSGGTVTLNASAGIEEIDFDNIGGGNYSIAASPGQSLTLSSTNGAASECLINVIGGSHAISAPLVLASPGNLVTTAHAADSVTFGGAVSGIGSLTKTGPGTVLFTAANTYTGVTNVNGGTLVAANTSGSATGSGNVTLNSGTFAGATGGGSVQGIVVAGSGVHTIAPGGMGTIGSLSVGGLVTAANLTMLDFDLTTPGGSGDLLVIGAGGLTLAQHTAIVFGVAPTALGDYRLIAGTFGTPALNYFDLPAPAPGQIYTLSTTIDPGYIDLVVAPEPPTMWCRPGGSAGDWCTATGNWDTGVPTSTRDACIDNGGTANIGSGAAAAQNVTVGDSAQGALQVAGGSLACSSLALGVQGGAGGTYAQSGGTVTVAGETNIGKGAGAGGSFSIGGGSFSTQDFIIGKAGAGAMAITDAAASVTVTNKLSFGANATFTAVPGGTIHLTGVTFENQSTNAAAMAGLSNLTLSVESGGGGVTTTLEAAGKNIGWNAGGFTSNFALGTLQAGTSATPASVKLVDTLKNQPGQVGAEAMHVNALNIAAGSTLDLNGLSLYYHTGTNLGTINLDGGQLIHDNVKTLHVWLDADSAAVGSNYSVRIWAQIIGGSTAEGLSDLAVTVYSPLRLGATVPKTGGNKNIATAWNPDLLGNYMTIAATSGDYDHDGDNDAVQMCIGDTYHSIPDLGNAPVLIATETWTMLAASPVPLAVSVAQSSRHWDAMLGKQSFAWPLGDFNHDGAIGAVDIDALYRNFGGGLAYDANGDGVVTQADEDYLVRTILHTGYGDANLDNKIDFSDFQTLLDHWMNNGVGWAQGDFTGNGTVDFEDFQRLLDNWNPTGITNAATVPEPATLGLLTLGALGLIRGRSRGA